MENGVDGIIVPLANENCAKAIGNLLLDKEKIQQLEGNSRKKDYSNSEEVQKLYKLLDDAYVIGEK